MCSSLAQSGLPALAQYLVSTTCGRHHKTSQDIIEGLANSGYVWLKSQTISIHKQLISIHLQPKHAIFLWTTVGAGFGASPHHHQQLWVQTWLPQRRCIVFSSQLTNTGVSLDIITYQPKQDGQNVQNHQPNNVTHHQETNALPWVLFVAILVQSLSRWSRDAHLLLVSGLTRCVSGAALPANG